MSASSDRTARLRYCNTEGQGKSSCCYPKTIGIDPTMNVVCLDPECSSITVDITGQTVNADISGQTVIADISGQRVVADITGQTVTAALDLMSNGAGDAFGRLRVSNPYTMFEFSGIQGKQPTILDEAVTGGGTSTWAAGDSYVNMAVTANGDRVIRQSHDYIPYQPGKSRLVLMTGVLTASNGGSLVTARIGSFDDVIGGVYIQFSNGVYSVNFAKLIGTSPSTSSIVRASWIDPLDGSGPSGISVDFTKAQIFLFDFEWLGVGQVRCGVVIGGQIYYYHIFTHINELVMPYVQMAKLPLRYDIRSNGSANSMRMICGTVISEGGFSPGGLQFILSTDISTQAYTLPNSNTFAPVLSLSLRTGNPYNRGTIKLEHIELFDLDSNVAGSWKVLFNPTITTSASWVDYDTARGSIARYRRDNGAGTITNEGMVLYQGYFYNRSMSTFITSIEELIAAKGIASDIAGTPDVLVLAVNWLAGSNNTALYCSLRWTEIM